MSDERRRHEREFPRRLTAALRAASAEQVMQILDESGSGLGLFASTLDSSLSPNQRVEVSVSGRAARAAVVRYLRSHPNGGYHVGIEWL